MDRYYFISYSLVNGNRSGFGNIFLSFNESPFNHDMAVQRIKKGLEKGTSVLILNFVEIDEDTFLENFRRTSRNRY